MTKKENLPSVPKKEVVKFDEKEIRKLDINDFESLINNGMLTVTDEDVKTILRTIYDINLEKIISRPDNLTPLIMLFAALQEYYEASSDKYKLNNNKIEMSNYMIKLRKQRITNAKKRIKALKARIKLMKNSGEMNTDIVSMLADCDNEIAEKRDLILALESEVYSLEINKDLKYFNVSLLGKSYAQIHTQLLKKQETILKMCKDQGIKLDNVVIETTVEGAPTTLAGIFAKLDEEQNEHKNKPA